MKSLKKLFWAGVIAAIAPSVGYSQTDTSGTGTTTSGGLGGGGLGSSSLNSNFSGGNTGNAASTGTAITISPPSQVQTSNQMNASNILGQYYANPMYQGRAGTTGSSTTAITNPGGFSTALYGNSGTGAGRTGGGSAAPSGVGGGGGFAGATGTNGGGATGRTGTTGATGGFGGTTGTRGITGSTGFGGATSGRTTGAFGSNTGLGGAGGGFGNTGGGTSQQNTGMISPRPIAYTATYKFPVAVITPTQQQSELRLLIDTSSQLTSAKGVQLTAKPGGIIVLQGQVADEDEARLIEGMMRITPGVRNVVNELKFPQS